MELTKEFFEEIVDIYDVMYNNMGLKSQKLSELLGGDPTKSVAPSLTKGIIKICASYMSEMWISNKLLDSYDNTIPEKDRKNITKFSEPTIGYDHCGINDYKSPEDPLDPEPIPIPSRFEPWSDAVKMLNWMGLDFHEGFRIVLIDDISPTNPYKETTNINCFTTMEKNKDSRGYFHYN